MPILDRYLLQAAYEFPVRYGEDRRRSSEASDNLLRNMRKIHFLIKFKCLNLLNRSLT